MYAIRSYYGEPLQGGLDRDLQKKFQQRRGDGRRFGRLVQRGPLPVDAGRKEGPQIERILPESAFEPVESILPLATDPLHHPDHPPQEGGGGIPFDADPLGRQEGESPRDPLRTKRLGKEERNPRPSLLPFDEQVRITSYNVCYTKLLR